MGNSGIHAQTEQRVICHACHTTFSARHGTVFYRLRTAAETVVRVVTVRAQGCRVHARVAAFGVDERTVAAWWARSGRPGQAGPESLIEHPRDLGQGQADELRVKNQGGMVWIALAMMVKTRLWLGGEVSAPRDLPLLRRLGARGRRCAARRPLVVCTAGLVSYSRAIRETFRAPVQTGKGGRPRRRPWRHGLIAPGGNHDERRRVVDTERHSGDGTPARVETRRRRSHGSGVLNTASSAPFRQRLAPRARRCRARARHTVTRPKGLVLVGPREHLCTPQERLSYPPKTPPAMAAAITDHGWTMQALRSCPGPLARWSPPTPRGRPSHALKGLIEPWSGNHGELWSYPRRKPRQKIRKFLKQALQWRTFHDLNLHVLCAREEHLLSPKGSPAWPSPLGRLSCQGVVEVQAATDLIRSAQWLPRLEPRISPRAGTPANQSRNEHSSPSLLLLEQQNLLTVNRRRKNIFEGDDPH